MNYRFYQWGTWGALAFALLISFFHRFSLGVVSDELIRDLQLTGTAFSNLGAVYFYIYAFMQIPGGVLVDSIGPRIVSTTGMLLASLGSILFALSTSFATAFTGRLLVALGVSIIFLSILKIQAAWFTRRQFSKLSGITSAVGNLGAVLAATPLAFMVLLTGWRWTFRGMGFLSLLCALILFLLARDTPEERGLEAPENRKKASSISLVQGIKSVLTNPSTWPNFFTISGLMGSSMTLTGVWGVPYLMQVQGFSREYASTLMLMVTMGLLIGSPVIGYLATRLDRVKAIIHWGGGMASVFWLFIILFPGLPRFLLPVLFFGLGFCSIVFFLCFTNVKDVNHPDFSGVATSVINFGAFISGSLTSLLVGYILDRMWDGTILHGVPYYGHEAFRVGLLVMFGFACMGFVSSFLIREDKGGPHYEQRVSGL